MTVTLEGLLAIVQEHGRTLKQPSKAEDREAYFAIGIAILDGIYKGDIVALRQKHNKVISLREIEKATGVSISRLSRAIAAVFAHRNVVLQHRDHPTVSQLALLGKQESKLDAGGIRQVTDAVFAQFTEPKWEQFEEGIGKFQMGGKVWKNYVKGFKAPPPATVAVEIEVDDFIRPESWLLAMSDALHEVDESKILMAVSTMF